MNKLFVLVFFVALVFGWTIPTGAGANPSQDDQLELAISLLQRLGAEGRTVQQSWREFSRQEIYALYAGRNLLARLKRAGDGAEREFSRMSQLEQKFVAQALTPVRFEPLERRGAMLNIGRRTTSNALPARNGFGCTETYRGVMAVGGFGNHLYEYGQSLGYCWENSMIARILYRHPRAQVYEWFWKFNGHLADSSGGGEGEGFFLSYYQGDFSLCLAKGWGCFLHRYPWSELKAFPGGTIKDDGNSG